MIEYVTVEEAAEILQVNTRHIKRMILSGVLRAKNISTTNIRKHWRVIKEDLFSLDNQPAK
jgi:excisionase family DNA binding protein